MASTTIPQQNEFLDEYHPLLSGNIVDEPYLSTTHYQNVHFLLLREDYQLPLRESIKRAVAWEMNIPGGGQNPTEGVQVYRDLTFPSFQLKEEPILNTRTLPFVVEAF